MAITRWRPLTEIDEMFQDLGLLATGQTGRDLATDIFQENDNIIVEIQVAGIDPDNLEVEVENNLLHICGSREETYEEEDRDYYSKEILRGSFDRLIPLPTAVNEDEASARINDGILRITLPMQEEYEKHAIGIDGGKESKKAAKSTSAKNGRTSATKKSSSRAKKAKTSAKSAASKPTSKTARKASSAKSNVKKASSSRAASPKSTRTRKAKNSSTRSRTKKNA